MKKYFVILIVIVLLVGGGVFYLYLNTKDEYKCKDIAGGEFSIVFDTNGGVKIDDISVCVGCENSLAGELPVAERRYSVATSKEYAFEGWYYDRKLTNKVKTTAINIGDWLNETNPNSEASKKMHTENEMTTYELCNELGKLPLAFNPGDKWNYGLSADVLGAIVEIVSGMKYSEYLSKNIFEPLGMKDTGFFVPKEKQERLARAYNSDGVRFSEYTGENLLIQSRMEEQPKFESGGAGLVSTIDDYSKICQMFLNNGELGGHRILHPETIRFMSLGSLNEAQRSCIGGWNYLNGYTYGNLLRILKYPGEAVSLGVKGEFGWDGWLGVYVSIIPEYDMYILYMQQKPDTGTTDVVNKIRNVIFSSIM